jgi:methylmalonyl-CoA mutase cobalamin-binding subunit
MIAPNVSRSQRRSVVVLAGSARTGERTVRALVDSLGKLGVETRYLGREERVQRIAAVVVEEGADAVEVCLGRSGGGALMLRELLRELTEIGRRDVSIVVHRVE